MNESVYTCTCSRSHSKPHACVSFPLKLWRAHSVRESLVICRWHTCVQSQPSNNNKKKMSLLIYLFIYLFVFRSSVTIDSYLECLEVHFLIAVQGIYEKYEPFSCLSAKNALIFYLFFFRRSQVSVLHRLIKLIHVLAFCLGTRRCTSIISITHQTPKVPCFSLKACARCSVLFFHVNQFA